MIKQKESPIRLTPVIADCPQCAFDGLQRSGFDASRPFTVLSGLDLSSRRRASMITDLLGAAEGEVFVVVSSPAVVVQNEPVAVDDENGDENGDGLDEFEMRSMLGLDPEVDPTEN